MNTEREPNPFLNLSNWCDATLDMNTFGLEQVHLRDAAYRGVDAWRSAYAQHGEYAVETRAQLFAAYVDHGPASLPPRGDVKAWKAWISEQRAKVVDRLAQAIYDFRAILDKTSVDLPNGSAPKPSTS